MRSTLRLGLTLLLALCLVLSLGGPEQLGLPIFALLVADGAASGQARRACLLGLCGGLLQDALCCLPLGCFASLYACGGWLLAGLATRVPLGRGLWRLIFLAGLLYGELGFRAVLHGVFPPWRWTPLLLGVLASPLVVGWRRCLWPLPEGV